ncbi:transcription elongation factor SPT5 [Microdochium nivale]|nr:transcription elongation factor SPT5 [Microdochium nivale]
MHHGPAPTEVAKGNRWLPRWCSHSLVSGYAIDPSKITNLVAQDHPASPRATLTKVLFGEEIDSAVWPLLFDGPVMGKSHDLSWTARFRSLPFLRALLSARPQTTPSHFLELSRHEQRQVGLGVRDLYLAAWRGLLDGGEASLLKDMTSFLDNPVDAQIISATMPISFHPSASFRMLKFVEDLDSKVKDESLRPYFAQVLLTPRLFAVFVDPADLSYHNFENIIPLDAWFESERNPASTADMLPINLTRLEQVHSKEQVWTGRLQLDSTSEQIIQRLATLDLYVLPLNRSARGGERFIFHSNLLSRSLTRAVQRSELLEDIAAASKGLCPTESFRFVNYVIRCNRFAPGADMFMRHRDTPYYDSKRSHISKYTLLVYLTSGHAARNPGSASRKPALRVKTRHSGAALPGSSSGANTKSNGDICFYDVDSMQFVVFDQSLEHEGHPFVDKDKIFLRTELVFEESRLASDADGGTEKSLQHHDRVIASLFSEACYMTGNHGIFDDELALHAHRCYEKVNALHWGLAGGGGGGESKQDGSNVFLHKRFGDLQFLTNGYNYWFVAAPNRGSGLEDVVQKENAIRDCAAVAVLDHFNCRVGGRRFRSLLRTSTIRDRVRSDADVRRVLGLNQDSDPGTEQPGSEKPGARLRRLDRDTVSSLFKKEPNAPFAERKLPWKDEGGCDSGETDGAEPGCCPFHSYETFDAWDSTEVRDVYETCCAYTRRQILGRPIAILDREEEIMASHENIIIEGDKVYFLRGREVEGTGPNADPQKEKLSGRINFAACWNDVSPTAFIGVDREIGTPQMLIPPLQFREMVADGQTAGEERGDPRIGDYHFMLDFFRNDWVVKMDDGYVVPIPIIANDIDAEEMGQGEESAFLSKTPGYDFDFARGLEIQSDEESVLGNKNSGTSGLRRSSRFQGAVDTQRDKSIKDDGMLEMADEDWATESEAAETDQSADSHAESLRTRRRVGRRNMFLDIEAEVLSDDDLTREDPDELPDKHDADANELESRKRRKL